ncbi:Neurotrophin receptor-interacting factor [Amphibalanus amphitrite]|uniref:Neurotrophin receptor-interacting factor n=1 Tax=Amphibalanus amphitrite TaxID=1232801 RepID=A0A6A4WG04_AMPAM|nr:Neurotrophin receptor-interacting factor [Amphibalanus amphitrite]
MSWPPRQWPLAAVPPGAAAAGRTVPPSTNAAVIVCPDCGIRFRSSSSYSQHKAKHRGETKCHVCGRIYSNRSNLRAHLRSHETFPTPPGAGYTPPESHPGP